MNIPELIGYLQRLADDFELQERPNEAIYLRDAAAIVASHTVGQLNSLQMTMGEQVFNLMTGQK